VQCKLRTSERTRRPVAKRGRTASKTPEYAAERAFWRDGQGRADRFAGREGAGGSERSCAGRFSLPEPLATAAFAGF
jgi:hypothetical protein